MGYKKIGWLVFALMVVAQLYVPGKMIFYKEEVLAEGKAYKFKTAPVDPADPFRGKYVRLAFTANEFTDPEDREWQSNDNVYLSLGTDDQGFAMITGGSSEQPENTDDYLMATVAWATDTMPTKVRVLYPFDRLYMEESKAKRAEELYWDASGDSSMVAYALVYIKDGEAVLDNVFINDVPIDELVERERLKTE